VNAQVRMLFYLDTCPYSSCIEQIIFFYKSIKQSIMIGK